MSNFGASFAEAFTPAYQQGAGIYADKIKQALLEKQRIEEDNRKRQQLLVSQLSEAGLTIPYGPDGKTLDERAAFGSLGSFQRQREAVKPYEDAKSRNKADLEKRAAAVGFTQPKINVGAPVAPQVNKPMEQQIAEAEQARELEKYSTERNATADAQIRANAAKESMSLKNIKAEAVARNIDPESDAGKKFIAFRMRLSALPADAKYATLTVHDMVKTGLVKDDPDAIEREEARLLPFGGKTPTLSASMEKAVADESNLVMNISGIEKAINAFEKKYGAGSFDRYAGPIDNRTNEWKLQLSKGVAAPADLDAKRIAQMFQTTYNADLKATSGGAVTDSEAARKLVEAGSLNGANFKNSLRGWKEARVMGLKNKERVLGAFAVPKGLFNYGDDDAAAPATPSTAAPVKKPISEMTDAELAAYEAELRGSK